MRYLFLAGIAIFFLAGCSSDRAPDCLQTAGSQVQREFVLPDFSKVLIEDDLGLVVRQGPVQSVVLESGSNLIDDIQVLVEQETLKVTNKNGCNLFGDYGRSTIYVTSPNLRQIRNSSSYDVRSEGVLQFENLRLLSNTTSGPEFPQKGGDFYLNLDCAELSISANGQSVFYLQGSVESARISLTDEWPRLEAAQLMVRELEFVQRSAAPMIVHPLQSIRGQIYGTGDVICHNRPAVVEVEQFFTGRLVFVDP